LVDIKHLSDPPAERYVLAGLCNHGINAWIDNVDLLSDDVFTVKKNKALYSCIKYGFEQLDLEYIDTAAIQSCANDLGLLRFINKEENARHIQSIVDFPAEFAELNKFANKIHNLLLARKQIETLDLAQEKLLNVTGSEDKEYIISVAEKTLLDFTDSINLTSSKETNMLENTVDVLMDRVENPPEKIGLATGYPKYDDCIGGGLRRGTVNILGARIKVGKSMWGMNVGFNVASQGIPVLYLDTEMTSRDFEARLLARMTGEKIRDIERGKVDGQKLKMAIGKLQNIDERGHKFHHYSIAGVPTAIQFSLMRRWIHKHVGFTDGKTNDCLIIHDYLKIMDSKDVGNFQEYQALGFLLTKLHNFAVENDVPIYSMIQLNRDGISKETSDVISQSDRIAWLCTNFSILKFKSREELDFSPPHYGTHKLIPVLTRHGEGLPDMEYINVKGMLARGYFEEGLLRTQVDDEFGANIQNN